jgi:hypothetical protein
MEHHRWTGTPLGRSDSLDSAVSTIALLGLLENSSQLKILQPLFNKRSPTIFLIKTQISGFC